MVVTIRQLGEMGVKLLGIYYAASAVVTFAGVLVATLALPQIGGLPTVGRLFAMNLVSVLGLAVVAAVCLSRAPLVAGWLFSEDHVSLGPLSRRDCLFVGISLIGVAWAVSGVPDIVKAIGTAIWYAEGSRQQLFGEMMRQSADAFVVAVLSVVVGVGLVVSASKLAIRLDGRDSRSGLTRNA